MFGLNKHMMITAISSICPVHSMLPGQQQLVPWHYERCKSTSVSEFNRCLLAESPHIWRAHCHHADHNIERVVHVVEAAISSAWSRAAENALF